MTRSRFSLEIPPFADPRGPVPAAPDIRAFFREWDASSSSLSCAEVDGPRGLLAVLVREGFRRGVEDDFGATFGRPLVEGSAVQVECEQRILRPLHGLQTPPFGLGTHTVLTSPDQLPVP